MTFYTSGIRSKKELALITKAGGGHLPLLVDVYDFSVVEDYEGALALDSGAYKNMKESKVVQPNEFAHRLQDMPLNRFDFITSLDVFGDAQASFHNWIVLREKHDLDLMPVWTLDGDVEHLKVYLQESSRIGLGGLVPLLRDQRSKDRAEKKLDKQRRLDNLKNVVKLIEQHKDVFHLFGLCWTKAIEMCASSAASADSSKWLCGRRYRDVVYKNTRHGHLMQSPCRFIPDYKSMRETPDDLCVASAQNIDAFWREKRVCNE